MKRFAFLVIAAFSFLVLSQGAVNAQDSESATGQVSNMFDTSQWMKEAPATTGSGTDLSGLMSMFALPQNNVQLNTLATPNGWAQFMNPSSWIQMMNPATYAQMMSPGFYTQFMNPQNWLSWVNPQAYSNWLNPQTYIQPLNPMNYAAFMNPLAYMQMMNPYNYAAYINPTTYTQWFSPASYGFATPQSTTGAINWFDPNTWTEQLKTSE